MNSLSGFLYRRLARWITCEVHLLGKHRLSLDSKYQTNSLQDVFCHPFYWKVFGWLTQPPELVVDLGAHCGHFSMLADTCFRLQFPDARPEYLLIEPNPELVEIIKRNLQRSGLCPQHRVQQGLVGGQRTGSATLWVSPRNYLSASLTKGSKPNGIQAEYIDLEKLAGNRRIDLLKIDIEGAEFEFVEHYGETLKRVQALMIEIHTASEAQHSNLFSQLQNAGLRLHSPVMGNNEYSLAMFQRY